jgi:hypothetical protein
MRLVQFPKHGTGIVDVDRVSLEQERGDDSEVSTSAAQRPEKILMVSLTGSHKTTISQYDISSNQVVDGQATLSRQVSKPTTQCQPADAGRGYDSTGDRQAKSVGGMIHVAPSAASPNQDRSRCWIDARVADEREIDHQPILADP